MMFEIYTKEVEIKGEKYKLRPLSGRFLAPLYQIMGAFEEASKGKKEGAEILKAFDKETTDNLHLIALETFKKSYPEENVEVLDEFVSQNLLTLLDTIIQINMPNNKQDA